MKRLLFVMLIVQSIFLQANLGSQLELFIVNSDIQNIEFIIHELDVSKQTKKRLLELCQDVITKRLQDLETWNTVVNKSHTLCYERVAHDLFIMLSKAFGIVGSAGSGITLFAALNSCPISKLTVMGLASTTSLLCCMWCIQHAHEIIAKKRVSLENLYTNAIRIKQIILNVTPNKSI